MNRLPARRSVWALLAVLGLLAAACGSDDDASSSQTETETSAPEEASDDQSDQSAEADQTTESTENTVADEGDFPREVETAAGAITIEARPERIVSLSPTATEILYAVGAGDQVVAVDLFSNYPDEAPDGTLDAFTPDLEAILAMEPDLVIASAASEDIAAGIAAVGVPLLVQSAAVGFDDVYDQVAQTGEATGNIDGAATVNAEIRAGVDAAVASVVASDEPIRVFHEIDDSFYTVTSATFIGQVYTDLGYVNIADEHDPDGFGYPLIDGETIIAANPSMIVYTNQAPYTADDIAARPGWDSIAAVQSGNVVEVDADIASRWGPRIVEFMQSLADASATASS